MDQITDWYLWIEHLQCKNTTTELATEEVCIFNMDIIPLIHSPKYD